MFENFESPHPVGDQVLSSPDSRGEVLSWHEVYEMTYALDEVKKENIPPGHFKVLRIDYRTEKGWISDWFGFDHPAFSRKGAMAWWRNRSTSHCPLTPEEALKIALDGGLAVSKGIQVRWTPGEPLPQVIDHVLGGKQEYPRKKYVEDESTNNPGEDWFESAYDPDPYGDF